MMADMVSWDQGGVSQPQSSIVGLPHFLGQPGPMASYSVLSLLTSC